MILALDVGNTQILGGVFDPKKDQFILQFRKTSTGSFSSDEHGIFLRTVLRENNLDLSSIRSISISSVVPALIYSLRSACVKYFDISPFILSPGTKTGIQIKYKNPLEVGADRIANAIAATHLYPERDVIAIDLGTATTFDVITRNKEYLGGAILPGIKISAEVLEEKTAKLPSVEIVKPTKALGQTTVESIQSGIYHMHLGAMKHLVSLLSDSFQPSPQVPLIIGTGGFSHLFADSGVFSFIERDLVLKGIVIAAQLNQNQ